MSDVTFNTASNRGFGGLFKFIFTRSSFRFDGDVLKQNADYMEALTAAKRDLENIDRLFNSTSDPDLIEYAIYEERAIKLKLSYLYRHAKENKMKFESFTSV